MRIAAVGSRIAPTISSRMFTSSRKTSGRSVICRIISLITCGACSRASTQPNSAALVTITSTLPVVSTVEAAIRPSVRRFRVR